MNSIAVGATRDMKLVAIDAKLEPKLAQFRVMMRMFASRLRTAFGRRIGWDVFPWLARFTLGCFEALVVTLVVELAMTLPMPSTSIASRCSLCR